MEIPQYFQTIQNVFILTWHCREQKRTTKNSLSLTGMELTSSGTKPAAIHSVSCTSRPLLHRLFSISKLFTYFSKYFQIIYIDLSCISKLFAQFYLVFPNYLHCNCFYLRTIYKHNPNIRLQTCQTSVKKCQSTCTQVTNT